ncbi:LOW QUALITY PROTEIN: hypothetical protein QYF61_023237 [Mycteria americana]|uniref:Uncharacterized protein n=1 Tax=Mycteria americana TaxID=33587 RepID=A0AAN7N0U7_MYCAM|nr:LOW QUALITY PROTEIN: hypothetical protein QYF61_023237 [Mycteria americana]
MNSAALLPCGVTPPNRPLPTTLLPRTTSELETRTSAIGVVESLRNIKSHHLRYCNPHVLSPITPQHGAAISCDLEVKSFSRYVAPYSSATPIPQPNHRSSSSSGTSAPGWRRRKAWRKAMLFSPLTEPTAQNFPFGKVNWFYMALELDVLASPDHHRPRSRTLPSWEHMPPEEWVTQPPQPRLLSLAAQLTNKSTRGRCYAGITRLVAEANDQLPQAEREDEGTASPAAAQGLPQRTFIFTVFSGPAASDTIYRLERQEKVLDTFFSCAREKCIISPINLVIYRTDKPESCEPPQNQAKIILDKCVPMSSDTKLSFTLRSEADLPFSLSFIYGGVGEKGGKDKMSEWSRATMSPLSDDWRSIIFSEFNLHDIKGDINFNMKDMSNNASESIIIIIEQCITLIQCQAVLRASLAALELLQKPSTAKSTTTPCPSAPHVHLQGWGLNHFPGQPLPMLHNPFREEIVPHIQSKPLLAQLEAMSSCPITCYLGEETNTHHSTTSFQGVVESHKVSPQPPFLQAKQPQLPQPLLTRLLLQTLHQLRCPSLDTLQHLNVSLGVRGPKLNTAFEVRPHQCRVQGDHHFPSPAGHTIPHTSQDAIGFLGHLGTLLAHIQVAIDQHPQVLFCLAAFQPLFPKPVALHGVAVTQVQDLALSLVEPHTVGLGPSIQPVQVPLQSLPILKQIDTPTQLGVICKLTEGAFDPLIQTIDKDIKQNWPQHRALGNTICDRPPTGFKSIHHNSLGPTIQQIHSTDQTEYFTFFSSNQKNRNTSEERLAINTTILMKILQLALWEASRTQEERTHDHHHVKKGSSTSRPIERNVNDYGETKFIFWSSSRNLALPSPPLHHVPQHHIYLSFKYLHGWGLNHFPGKPFPMLHNPFREEMVPHIQSKPSMAQLEAISSRPIACYLGEETNTHLSTPSFQAVEESHKVSPQPPFLQAKQPQVPQPLLIRLVLQTLHQLRCPSLDTLQHLNVSLGVRGPKLNTAFEVWPHQCRVQGDHHFPSPAGHTIPHTSQDAIGFLGHLGTLLAHIQPAVNQHPQVLFLQAAFQPLFPKPVALHGVAVAQDLALGLVKPHTVVLSPSIQPVQVPLQSLPTLKQINTPTQLGVICKLTEGALDPLIQIIDKDIKQNWPQHRALGNTTCDRPPTGFKSIHHNSWGPAIQPVLYPVKSTPLQAMSSQFLQENAVGNHVKGFTKV